MSSIDGYLRRIRCIHIVILRPNAHGVTRVRFGRKTDDIGIDGREGRICTRIIVRAHCLNGDPIATISPGNGSHIYVTINVHIDRAAMSKCVIGTINHIGAQACR